VPQRKPLAFDPIAEARRQWRSHGWDEAADGMASTTSIVRVDQILRARIDAALRPFGLTFSRFELLVLLDFSRRGELPMGKLGERLQVHPASVTNAVDRLEVVGLVVRRPHPDDGRAMLASITADGRRIARRAAAAVNGEVFTDLGLDDREQATLFDLLRRVRVAAGDFASPDEPA
jgi:DNA-binding MarR family transcriptional regulator